VDQTIYDNYLTFIPKKKKIVNILNILLMSSIFNFELTETNNQ